MPAQKRWTPQEIEDLKKLRGTASQIAIQLGTGRSHDSVRHKLQWLVDQSKLKSVVSKQSATVGSPVKTKPQPVPRHSTRQVNCCMNCNGPVSNWDDHLERLGKFGCVRP